MSSLFVASLESTISSHSCSISLSSSMIVLSGALI